MSFALSAVQAAETDGLLLWMVFDDYDAPQVDDCGVYKYIDELVSRSPDGYKVNGARLRVAGTDTYLGISEDGAGAKPYANGLLTIAPDPEKRAAPDLLIASLLRAGKAKQAEAWKAYRAELK